MLYNCGIYKLTFPNGKFYIGQTINWKFRKKNHKRCSTNSKVNNAIREYGWDNINKEFLVVCNDFYNLNKSWHKSNRNRAHVQIYLMFKRINYHLFFPLLRAVFGRTLNFNFITFWR